MANRIPLSSFLSPDEHQALGNLEPGFWSTISYYTGYRQYTLEQNCASLAAVRAERAYGFLDTAPTSVIGLRNCFFAAKKISNQMKSLQDAAQESRRQFHQDLDDLNCIVKLICQIAYAVLGFFMGGSENAIHEMRTVLEGTPERHPRNGHSTLHQICRGAFRDTPNNQLGIRVSETTILKDGQRTTVGVYARLGQDYADEHGRYADGVVHFHLSQDGVSSLGTVRIFRNWHRNADFHSPFDEGQSDAMTFNGPLVNRHLHAELDSYHRGTHESVWIKLAQIMVEVLVREKENALICDSVGNQSYVLLAGGFEPANLSDKKPLMGKLLASRLSGVIFPMETLRSGYRFTANRNIHTTRIMGFEVENTTWKDIIEADPIFPGQDPILPHHFRRDLRTLEAASAPDDQKG
jgi:hypothetical protein